MLTYLINVTSDLLMTALVTGVILAFADLYFGERARLITKCGLLTGVIAAVIRAYITNTRRLVGGWKVGVYGYAVSLAVFVLFIVCFIIYMRRSRGASQDGKTRLSAVLGSDTALSVIIALLITTYFYGALPNTLVYPFKFDIGTSGILSTDFLFRFGGYLLGIIISLAAALSAYKIMSVAEHKSYGKHVWRAFLCTIILAAVNSFARLMLVLTPRKIVDSRVLFKFAAGSNNHSEYYTYIAFAIIFVLAGIIWVGSRTANEPYRNPAEHRRQRAVWRTGKRYSVAALCCLVMAVLCSTWFVKLNTVQIHEAPVEDPVVVKNGSGADETLVVPVEAVSDGHMHRFGYESDGHLVRFIIVLKQEGTTNYGVGLDACDICGEAGYFENKDGQIVCKKCNVVMNRTTIGMKGGCNPIIIDYDFDGSQFTVPVTEMTKNADKFSSGQ